MTGISQNAKNGNLPEFGEAVATASKALCGFTEAAAQVILWGWSLGLPCCPYPTSSQPDTHAQKTKLCLQSQLCGKWGSSPTQSRGVCQQA